MPNTLSQSSNPKSTRLTKIHYEQHPPLLLENTSPHSPRTPLLVCRALSLIFPREWPLTEDNIVPGLVPNREGGLE